MMKTQINKNAILVYAKLIVEVIDALSKVDIKYPYKLALCYLLLWFLKILYLIPLILL